MKKNKTDVGEEVIKITETISIPFFNLDLVIEIFKPTGVDVKFSLFDDTDKILARERLEDAVEEIRRRFGKKAMTYASLLGDLKMPGDGRCDIIMPSAMFQ